MESNSKTPKEDALEHIVACRDKPFLEERFIDSVKGRGVFTRKTIEPSTFVVEYRGKIKHTRPKRKCGDTLNNYFYTFSWKGEHWCIDASKDDGTLGRLVNDDHLSPNCEMKKVKCEGRPHLCLFAVKQISPGEEITYNYGDSSYLWRQKGGDLHSEESCSDDDSKGSSNLNSQDFGEDATQECTSSPAEEAKASLRSDELTKDDDYVPNLTDMSSDEHASDTDNVASEVVRELKAFSHSTRNYCYVCGKGMTKIARHLLRHSAEEPDIAQAFAAPANSKERKRLLENLRNRGNYKHNQEVLRTNSGVLKTRRQPKSIPASAKTHVHCLYCKGMVSRREMWRHVGRCTKRYSSSETPDKKRDFNEIALAGTSLAQKNPSEAWKILLKMKQDETTFIVQNDYLLIQLTEDLLKKYSAKNKHDMIRLKLRNMGRLLLTLHGKSIFSFEDAIKPKNFSKVVETVKSIAGFNKKKKLYVKPRCAMQLVYSLKQIASTILSRTDNSEEMVRDARRFIAFCREEWSRLSNGGKTCRHKAKGPSTIPFTCDVQVFYSYLETTSASATSSMKKYESPQVYNALCKVTVAQVSILNKGAPEASNMTVKSFQERGDATKVLSKNFIRINIPSSQGQNVAVLLTSELVDAITLLLSKRLSCGVHTDNPFLFAKSDGSASSLNYAPGCVMSFARLCRAKEPQHLRSTRFLKHIARVFQILNLENDELVHLAKLLGHDIRTERDYYRLPEAAVALAKIAKLLQAMEKGSLERFKGNSLDEIEIEDTLEPEVQTDPEPAEQPGAQPDGESDEGPDAEPDGESDEGPDAEPDGESDEGPDAEPDGESDEGPDAEPDGESDDEPDEDQINPRTVDDEQQVKRLTPEQDALEHIKACRDKAFLEGLFIDQFKGKGLFTHESIEPSAFVVEYRGNIFTRKEVQKSSGDTLNDYMFDFSWDGKYWCVDASTDDGTLGRLVNDEHISPNCEVKKIVHEGKPHLCLFALKKIFTGEEITYNYGDCSYEWRSVGSCEKLKTTTDKNAPSSRNEKVEDSREPYSSGESCCDDDYVPDDIPSSDDDFTSNDNKRRHDFNNTSAESKPKKLLKQQSNSEDEADESPSLTNKNFCFVCGKAQTKISRHFRTHRKENAEIAEVFALRIKSKKRKVLLEMLRNRGNNKHNEEVLMTRRGELKVKRVQSNSSITAKNLAPCIYCKGLFVRKDMWRHLQKCSSNQFSGSANIKILTFVAASVMDPHEVPPEVKEILKTLRKDEISSVVQNDFYILQLAQYLCHLNGGKNRNFEYIKNRLRLMGRLLLLLQKRSVCSFEDAMKLENFTTVTEAVKELVGFNEEMQSCDRQSLVLKVGDCLKKIGEFKYARALKEDANEETIQKAKAFMALCAKEWSNSPLTKPKESPSTVPFTQNVQIFHQFMEKTAASAFESLSLYESPQVYKALLFVTVAHVSILNKNVSNVMKVTLQSFKEREEAKLQDDAAVAQSQFEQILCKRFVKINLVRKRGKKNGHRKVVVLLTPELISAITLLVNKREACGVHINNPFLFGGPSALCTTFYPGQKCLNIFVARCNIKNQGNLKSPFFRKHIARIFQILSLTNDELNQLAKLLGRDIRTDREYYQTPEAAGDIAKILQLLSAVEKGSVEKFEGKSIEEIEIEDELQPDVEKDNLDSCSDEEDDKEKAKSSPQSRSVSSLKRSVSVSPVKKRGRGRPRSRKPESEDEESEMSDDKNDEVNTEKDDKPVKSAVSSLSHSKDDTTVYFSDDDEDMNVDFDMDIDTDEDVRNEQSDGEKQTASMDVDGSNSPATLNAGVSSLKGSSSSTKEGLSVGKYNRGRKQESKSKTLSPVKDATMNVCFTDDDEAMHVSSVVPQGSPVKKRGRGRPRSRKLESEGEETNYDKNHEVNRQKNDRTKPVKGVFSTSSRSKEDTTNVCFSDDDEDMHVSSVVPQGSPVKKRGRGRPRSRKLESEEETNYDKNDEVNREKDDRTKPVKGVFSTPSRSKEDTTNVCFSDDDEDMHVDFDMDIDTDEDVRNDDGDVNASATTNQNVGECRRKDEQIDEAMDVDTEDHLEKKDQEKGGKQNNSMDSSGSSARMNTAKKKRLSPPLPGMKDVKILLPKLDMEAQGSIHISQLASLCSKWPLKDRLTWNTTSKTSRSTDVNKKPGAAKDTEMTCSHCRKRMMKGQTAYQKKGFSDVFCSKDCLFEMFPVNKPAAKTCHYCLKAIAQPLDLIMAVVDIKGTIKDFCSVMCLASFKSNTASTQTQQSLCSMCNKSCTATCELTLNEDVHKFCSDSCMKGFCRNNMAACENCSSPCRNKLVLKLEEGTKTICSNQCLEDLKENIKTPQPCTMCHDSQPVSGMVSFRSLKDTVELFCSRYCVTSYKLASAAFQGEKGSTQLKSKQLQLNTEDVQVGSDSPVNKDGASSAAASDTTPTVGMKGVLCSNCENTLQRGATLYQAKGSHGVFCSASCLSERHPNMLGTKSCYNCFQVIKRPHDIILAPVDDSGTMKELCSETCLASVKSKRKMPASQPRSECRMCAKICHCKLKLSLNGVVHTLCSNSCLINYHKVNNLPMLICDVCSFSCPEHHLVLNIEDGSKNICSDKCLVKFKETVKTPQLCPMCQTSHQMSDMVENKNEDGSVQFFCSNRCMMVCKAPSSMSEQKEKKSCSPSEECDIKEVKPSLTHLDCIKQEPVDDEYLQSLSPSLTKQEIKDEPNVTKEDLKIGSVFSLTGDSMPAVPTIAQMDLPVACSNCKRVLIDGETVYQRKGHMDLFCSTSCLMKSFQIKPVKQTCQFCLQVIAQDQDAIQAPVDTDGTMKAFCSQACLTSLNYKKLVSSKIPIVPVGLHSQCSMCSRYSISKHEVIQQGVIHKMCSRPCFLRFCNMNKMSICENCHSECCSELLTLRMEDGNKNLCSNECLTKFKEQKIKTQQPCAMCRTSKMISDMVENRNSQDVVEFFCTSSCVMASKIQAISATGTPLNCDHCRKTSVPACHLAMSDASVRNFCTLACAMAFKEMQKDTTASSNSTGTTDQTLNPSRRVLCAQCRCIIESTPKVIQRKDEIYFVCSLACRQEYKRINNITGMCEFCKNEKIITDTKRVNGKDCHFCSDGCKMLFRDTLGKKWGKHCRSCAYCHSISKTVVTAKCNTSEMDFCSEDCSLNFKMLLHRCDTCGREASLSQILPLLGEVKQFCDLKCLLHFCSKKNQAVDADSSPPPSATVDSSPVIANVMSLANALANHSSASSISALHASVSDIQNKVVGHASIQTVPKELKNKSVLCTPLVHNKGVSCTTQTVDTEAQTDNFVPKVIVLPLPVPVYVPLPMNMYSQYTPEPVGLPLPLPVPVLLPVTSSSSEPTLKETIEPKTSKGRSEVEIGENDRTESQDVDDKDREVVQEGKKEETQSLTDRSNSCSHELDKQTNQDDSSADTSCWSHNPQFDKPPLVLDADLPNPPDSQSSQRPEPEPAPPLLKKTEEKVHNKNKRKLQQLSTGAKEGSSLGNSSKTISMKHCKLKSQYGIDAWKRWIQWRESQTNTYTCAVKLKENLLHCSPSDLNIGLSLFINEVKRPDGKTYRCDRLFLFCLSIQQYLLENGRMENIFSDQVYKTFSSEFTRILKHFKPSAAASTGIPSRVKEQYLWDCKQLGAYSPIVLLNTLLFFFCKHFGFTTMGQHRQLSFANIVQRTKMNSDNTKSTFLRFYLPVPPNKAESVTNGVPAKKRKLNEKFLELMENTENPLRCPVRLYEFYLSKCAELVKQHSSLFYLQPDHCCVPSSPLWFSSTPLDDVTMKAMLVRALAVRDHAAHVMTEEKDSQ